MKAETSTCRFKELYSITEQICSMPDAITCNSISADANERWNILLDVWKNNSRKLGSNIFLNPLNHIFFSEYITRKSKKIVQLLQKIEDALLYDQEAFCAWIQTELFKEAYIKAFNHISWFRSYVYFQLAQGSIRLFKNKDSTMLENIPFLAQCYRSPLTDIPRQISIYTEKKNIIVKILPEAAHWPDEQLANYPYFCTCIKEKYGVDYSGSVIDAEPLFDLLEYAEKPDRFENPDKFPYFPTIASADMTYNMISSICGNEADEIIFETLLGTVWYKRENTFLDTPRITDTWVYPIVEKWAYDKNHRLHKYAQRIIFDINTSYVDIN